MGLSGVLASFIHTISLQFEKDNKSLAAGLICLRTLVTILTSLIKVGMPGIPISP